MSAEMVSAIGSVLATLVGIRVSWQVWRGQRLLSQRQLILPLWTHMSSLNEINPNQPITPDIVKAVNTLELVALCCEGDMVDTRVIKRTFATEYLKLYNQIEGCSDVPGLNKTGKNLLSENPAAMKFYDELSSEHKNRGSLTK